MIEAQTAILMERVANAQDFKEAERSHKAFMDALVMQVGRTALHPLLQSSHLTYAGQGDQPHGWLLPRCPEHCSSSRLLS